LPGTGNTGKITLTLDPPILADESPMCVAMSDTRQLRLLLWES
jgi:hypothetical protein